MTRTLEGRVVDPVDGEHLARVQISDDRIADVSSLETSDETNYILPGFIDVHLYDDTDVAAHGVTGYLLTCGTSPAETVNDFLGARPVGAVCLGAHLEGPFLNPDAAGAQAREHIIPVDRDLLRAWLATDAVRMVTVAPEIEGGLDAVRTISESGAIASIGHTRANYYTTRAAVDEGARFATHLWNAMSGFTARVPGAVGTLLADERMTVGLITDGRHLHPVTEQLTVKIAGPSRIAATSDLVPPPHERPEDGKLLGGDRLGAALVKRLAEYGLEAAAAMTSLTPARVLGLDDRGRIAPGYRADLAVLDSELSPVETIAGGTSIWHA